MTSVFIAELFNCICGQCYVQCTESMMERAFQTKVTENGKPLQPIFVSEASLYSVFLLNTKHVNSEGRNLELVSVISYFDGFLFFMFGVWKRELVKGLCMPIFSRSHGFKCFTHGKVSSPNIQT